MLSSTFKESVGQLHSRLLRCGFNYIDKEDIFSSLAAAKRYVVSRNLRPMLFLEPEAMEDFQGFKNTISQAYCEYASSDVCTTEPNAVVIGLAPSGFHFSRLNEAFKLLLHNEHANLIAIHKGKYYRRGDGIALGPGPFVECIEFATGKKVNRILLDINSSQGTFQAVVVGKPEVNFFSEALEACRRSEQDTINPADAVMIISLRHLVIGYVKGYDWGRCAR